MTEEELLERLVEIRDNFTAVYEIRNEINKLIWDRWGK